MKRTHWTYITTVLALLLVVSAGTLVAQEETEEGPIQILFTNVNIFDGFADRLQEGMSVLVEGNYIKQVGRSISAPGAIVVDGGGRTMTPGLIDMHQHVMLNPPEGTAAYQTRWDDAAGGAFAHHHLVHNMLMKGITTVRDIAGDPLDIAKAIDMGHLPGHVFTPLAAPSPRPEGTATGRGATFRPRSSPTTSTCPSGPRTPGWSTDPTRSPRRCA